MSTKPAVVMAKEDINALSECIRSLVGEANKFDMLVKRLSACIKLNLSVDAIFKDPVLSLNIMDSIMIGSVLAESSNSHGVLNFMNNIETLCCCKKQIDDAIS